MAEKKTQLKIEVSVRDQATKAFGQMAVAVKNFGGVSLSTITGLVSKFTGLGALIGGLFSAQQLFASVKGAIELSQAVEDLADAFGTTVESMSAVAAASKAYGVETDALTIQLKTYAKVVEDAAAGNDKAQQTLRRLGITAAQIDDAGNDLVAQLSLVSDGLARLDGTAAKATVATQLFGRQGIKMLELVGDGSEKFRGLVDEVKGLGLVLDQEGAKKAAEFESTMAKLGLRLQLLGQNLSLTLIPVLQKLGDLLFVDKEVVETFNRIGPGGLGGDPGNRFGAGPPIKGERSDRRALRESLAEQNAALDEKAIEAELRRAEQAKQIEEQAFVRSAQLRERRRREVEVGYDRELRQLQKLWLQDGVLVEQQYNAAVQALRQDHAQRMREIDGSVFEGLEDGLREAADKLTDFYAQGREAALDLASGLQAAFNAASEVIIQDIKNIEGAWKAFRDVFIRVLADMLAKLLSAQAVGFVLGLFTGGGGAPAITPGAVGSGGRGPRITPGAPGTGGGGGGDGGGSLPGGVGLGGLGPQGGGGNHTTINIYANDSKSFKEMAARDHKFFEDMVEAAVSKGSNRSLALTVGRRR